MAPDKEKLPVAGDRRQKEMDSEAAVDSLKSEFAEIDPESKGYDPYDNPGPEPVPSED